MPWSGSQGRWGECPGVEAKEGGVNALEWKPRKVG